jgi:hypothetical protein
LRNLHIAIALIILFAILLASYVMLIVVVKSQRVLPSSCGACGELVPASGSLQCASCHSDLLKVGVSAGVIMREPPRSMMIALAVVVILSLVQLPLDWAYSKVRLVNAPGLGTAVTRTMTLEREKVNPVMFQLDIVDHLPHAGEKDLLPQKWIDLRQLAGPGDFPEPFRVDLVRDGAMISEVDQIDPMSVSQLRAWFSKTGDFDEAELTRISEGVNLNVRHSIGARATDGFGIQSVGLLSTGATQSGQIIPVGWRVWGVFWGASLGTILLLLVFGVALVSWLARGEESS